MRHERQALLIDADDTLWETNLKFERTIGAFCQLIAPLGYPEDHVRRQVEAAERANIARRGYGARSFLLTLEEVYLSLAGHRALDTELEDIRRLARILVDEPMALFDGVAETLAYLAPRHRLLYFTKGDATEQARKLASSGLEKFFEAHEIVPEKNQAAYQALVARHALPPGATWMVGNSPRSDINPALAAGLNAVFIPSVHNWEYENEEIRRAPDGSGGLLLVLKNFSDLQEHF